MTSKQCLRGELGRCAELPVCTLQAQFLPHVSCSGLVPVTLSLLSTQGCRDGALILKLFPTGAALGKVHLRLPISLPCCNLSLPVLGPHMRCA